MILKHLKEFTVTELEDIVVGSQNRYADAYELWKDMIEKFADECRQSSVANQLNCDLCINNKKKRVACFISNMCQEELEEAMVTLLNYSWPKKPSETIITTLNYNNDMDFWTIQIYTVIPTTYKEILQLMHSYLKHQGAGEEFTEEITEKLITRLRDGK